MPPFSHRSLQCFSTPLSIAWCGVITLAVLGLVGCSSTEWRGSQTASMWSIFRREPDDAGQRPARSERDERRRDDEQSGRAASPAPREQKPAAVTAAKNTDAAASVASERATPRLTAPPAPTPATTAAVKPATPSVSRSAPNAPDAPEPPATSSTQLAPPPPPEPRIPAALRKKTVAETETTSTNDAIIALQLDDSPEIANLLADIRKAESVDHDKCEKIISELRKIDASADPAFYKSMVAFARTVLLPPPLKTNDDQRLPQNETPAIKPVSAAEAKPPQPATTTQSVTPPRPLAPSTVANVPPAPATTNDTGETTLTISPTATPPEPTVREPVPAAEAVPMIQPTSEPAVLRGVPDAVFVPRGGSISSGTASGSASSVVPVSYNGGGTARDGDWQRLVQQASQVLKAKATTTQDEIRLRLLALALGDQTEAARTIDGIDPAVRSFWASEMLGLSVLLDERSLPDTSSRNAAAVYHLARSQSELRKECPLKIQQMRFVEKWYGFGSYTTLAGDFDAGATASLYLELENEAVRESPLGFNTRSSSAYVLIDGAGTVVARVENVIAESTSQSRRRDSCLLIPIAIPKTISPGPYQLKITITDLNHDKLQYAIEQIPLRIRTSSRGGE